MNTDYKCLKTVHLFVTYFLHILCYWWRNYDVS